MSALRRPPANNNRESAFLPDIPSLGKSRLRRMFRMFRTTRLWHMMHAFLTFHSRRTADIPPPIVRPNNMIFRYATILEVGNDLSVKHCPAVIERIDCLKMPFCP